MSGYGSDRVRVERNYVHTLRQSNSPVRPQNNRGNTKSKQAEKQAGWRAEGSQEGEKGREKWKVGDKTQGGRSKKNFGEKKNENDWWEGKNKKSEPRFKKT